MPHVLIKYAHVLICISAGEGSRHFSAFHYQIIFTSPERLLADKEWRDVFQCELLHECVVGLIIDEAHCVHKWYVYNVHAQ